MLADAASSLPLHVYRKAADGRERVDSGALYDLLEHPAPATTQADLVSSLMTHLAICGNAYLAKYRSGGEIVQLGLLHPDRVRPELQGGQLRFRYSPPYTRGPQQLLTEADVVHVKGLTVDGLVGLSAVSQASRVLGLSDELVKHALSLLRHRRRGRHRPARRRPAARRGRRVRRPEPDQGKAQGRVAAARHPGDRGRGRIPRRSPSKLDDAQFVEQRRLAAQEIARVFRIPAAHARRADRRLA